jgi:hypothetical protein
MTECRCCAARLVRAFRFLEAVSRKTERFAFHCQIDFNIAVGFLD